MNYGICISETYIVQLPEFLNKIELLQTGSLVQINEQRDYYHTINKIVYNKTAVKWGNDEFLCGITNIERLSLEEFNILVAIKNRVSRYKIIKNKGLLNFIKKLTVFRYVSVINPGRIQGDSPEKLQCIVSYIGKVPEIGHGTFFGFLLQDDSQNIYHRGTLAPKYLNCSNNKGFLSSGDIFLKKNKRNWRYRGNRMGNNSNLNSNECEHSQQQINSLENQIKVLKLELENKDKKINDLNIPFEKVEIKTDDESCLIRNKTDDNCVKCKMVIKPQMGICIPNCLHVYCNSCMLSMIENSSSLKIQCIFPKCPHQLKENQIKFLAPKDLYEKLQKITEEIERRSKSKTFTCKVKDCKRFWSIEKDKINDLKISPCPKCNTLLCLLCDADHIGYSCVDYKKYKKLDYSNAKDNWICIACTFFNENIFSAACDCCGNLKLIYDINLVYESDDSNECFGYSTPKHAELDEINLIRNKIEFECKICYSPVDPGEGVILHECSHEFCDDCLIGQISNSLGAVVKCPYADEKSSCEKQLQDREIRALVSDELFEKYLQRSLRLYQSQLKDGFQCKTPDCIGFWSYDEYIISHVCEVCNQKNCLHCYAIHAPLSCKEYQEKLFNENDPSLIQTKKMFENMISVGKAMKCPSCKIIISRDEGCSWVKCSVCNLEICWVTKGPRWGPKGKGDTSGGCGCDFFNKQPCHPNCNYCH